MLDYYKILDWDTFSVNYFNYLQKNILPELCIKSHHDLACWSWIFVDNMCKNGYSSSWSNIAFDQIQLAKNRYPNLNFSIKDMTDFSLKNPVDLITCNNDAINHLYSFYEWEELFGCVYRNLNKCGYFIFDFHTLEQVRDENENKKSHEKDNYLIDFYEKGIGNDFYRSAWKIIDKESWECIKILKSYQTSFENDRIYSALKVAWFSDYVFLCKSDSTRKYILAFKWE